MGYTTVTLRRQRHQEVYNCPSHRMSQWQSRNLSSNCLNPKSRFNYTSQMKEFDISGGKKKTSWKNGYWLN